MWNKNRFTMIFSDSIESYIRRHDLLRHDGFYVVALSGGADSVALLRVLLALGYRVEAAHCNFHLRGMESNRDEAFCVALCESLHVGLHRIHFETEVYAQAHGVSIEMAARDLRYRYFKQLRQDIQANAVCVAHHSDDQVETILLHLLRGTGLAGLQGMKPRNGTVVRPLLSVSRQQILDYLAGLSQSYVTDSTNLEDNVKRNKLRLRVLPLLEEINSSAREHILHMSEHLQEAAAIVDHAVSDVLKAIRLDGDGYDLRRLASYPAPHYVLWHLLHGRGFNSTQIDEIARHGLEHGTWKSATTVVLIHQGQLYILDRESWETLPPMLVIPETGVYVYPAGTKGESETRFRLCVEDVTPDFIIRKSPDVAAVDAARIRFPLTLRTVQTGDRFSPFGMRGTKLVCDFLKDRKIPFPARRHQLVLTDAQGNIIWVVGLRIVNRFAIVPGRSQRALMISR